MMLVDAGPLVALFDPADGDHARCMHWLEAVVEPLCPTLPVLTEAFHLLNLGSRGSQTLMDFVSARRWSAAGIFPERLIAYACLRTDGSVCRSAHGLGERLILPTKAHRFEPACVCNFVDVRLILVRPRFASRLDDQAMAGTGS